MNVLIVKTKLIKIYIKLVKTKLVKIYHGHIREGPNWINYQLNKLSEVNKLKLQLSLLCKRVSGDLENEPHWSNCISIIYY